MSAASPTAAMRGALRGAGIVTALVLVVVAGACSPMDDAMVAIFGRSMRDQPSFDPYENPQPPAPGAVPFAIGNYVAADSAGTGLASGEWLGDRPPPFTQLQVTQAAPVVTEIPNPVAATPESLARGEEMYMRFCAPCHGPDGSGSTGYVVDNGMVPMPVTSPTATAHTDGMIYGLIMVGRGIMPAYGHRMTYRDRWHVVNYVRQLQGTSPEGTAASDTASAEPASADTAADTAGAF